jgi:23S rRNA pseudouridine1911/1915/1917 synthase
MKKKGQIWTVVEAEANLRLDKWLADAARLGSRSRALDALAKGKVFIDDVEQSSGDAARKMETGVQVRVWMDRPGSSERRFSERRVAGLHIIYEDDSFLVLNKPVGLLSVPLPDQPDQPSLYDLIRAHLRSHRNITPLIVHRIDRDTSGLVIFAKTSNAQHKLKEQFQQRECERVYLALVYGGPTSDAGVWRDKLLWDEQAMKQRPANNRDPRAKDAVSRYRRLESFTGASLLQVNLVTGKRNQIRIQAGLRGFPLIGEKKYIYENSPPRTIKFGRQALHALRLGFKHPIDGRALKFEIDPPEDFQKLLQSLRTQESKKV